MAMKGMRSGTGVGLATILLAACGPAAHRAAVPVVTAAPTVPPPTTTTTTAAPPATAVATTSAPAPAATTTTSAPVRASAVTAAPVTAAAPGQCPRGPAATLASTGPARQLITVESASYDTTDATVETWSQQGPCWVPAGGPWTGRIGENGFSDHHIEGDGTTPTGLYGLSSTFYGNAADPGVRGTYHQLVCGDWWDEDPGSATYNTFQHVACGHTPSFGGGSEALWTETAPYPSFAVIEYNTDPIVRHAGSGVFLHADTGSPTIGCVSLPLAQLDEVLRWLDPASAPVIVMGPATELSRF